MTHFKAPLLVIPVSLLALFEGSLNDYLRYLIPIAIIVASVLTLTIGLPIHLLFSYF